MEPTMGPTRREQLRESIWNMIQDNHNYTTGVRNFLVPTLRSALDLERFMAGDPSDSERDSWRTLMEGLKMPRRQVVATLIRDLRAEASSADVVEATPTGVAGAPAWSDITGRHPHSSAHSLYLAT
ncbi:hypothetical protein B484DRAFT_411067 [Ochromonadaceae sp. CCMP2298]|nr:hypothetical protein B484DRAFT_411067 [Ochromonadaceae sp. CCMP2298]